MKYRNISEPDAISYILLSFLQLTLTNNEIIFSEKEGEIISKSINTLTEYLVKTSPSPEWAWKQYDTRDNISSFVLAVLIGNNNQLSTEFLLENIKALQKRALKEQNHSLLDSNVDRTVKRIQGWIYYWEVLLFLKQKGSDILPFQG